MIKNWIQKALDFLNHSLNPVPQELNELDWKEELSPDNAKLRRHLSAFANQPGGGFMVFGIEDKLLRFADVNQQTAEKIVQRLGSLCRDSLNQIVELDYYDKANTLTMRNKLTGLVELESVSPSRSKNLIDAIDEEIEPKFKLTAEQIATIINYDIKYRMGLNGEEADANE